MKKMSKYYIELKEIDWFHKDTYPTVCGSNSTTFGGIQSGHDELFDDVKVFWLMFHRENGNDHREMWADPFRVETLRRIGCKNWNWYLSFMGYLPDSSLPGEYIGIENDLSKKILKEHNLNFTFVRSREICVDDYQRLYFESPLELIEPVVKTYWSWAEGNSIQGYLLPSGRIDILQKWDQEVRDDRLFREVIDQSFLAFSTFPDENRHFMFYSNKVNYEQLELLINPNELQEMANKIGYEECFE